ncbi:MAG: SPOR domain-containing protein, partial [Alphaproteobacteria bacterium]
GSYQVQLSAVRSEAAAEAEWKKLQKANQDLLGGLTLAVVRADLPGKGTFYRVRAGALSEQAARDLCAELKQRKAACLVVPP